MSADAGQSDLSASERHALACVLDAIIPPSRDGRLAGAGELGVGQRIEQVLQQSPEIRLGLAALDELAVRRAGTRGFADVARERRAGLLSELAAAQPGFLPVLIFHTYVAYYLDPCVREALGLEARPPFPKGYEVAPLDPARLDRVRRRAKMYRECP